MFSLSTMFANFVPLAVMMLQAKREVDGSSPWVPLLPCPSCVTFPVVPKRPLNCQKMKKAGREKKSIYLIFGWLVIQYHYHRPPLPWFCFALCFEAIFLCRDCPLPRMMSVSLAASDPPFKLPFFELVGGSDLDRRVGGFLGVFFRLSAFFGFLLFLFWLPPFEELLSGWWSDASI